MYKDLVGERFGRLVVVERVPNHGAKRFWLCQCDCGKIKEISGYHLKRRSTKSCGCLRIEVLSLLGDESSFNTFYGVYVSNSKKANRSFDLSKDEFRKITSLSCSYCGAIPIPLSTRGRVNKVVTYVCNGIDRVDNSLGYTKENCVSCCSLCNLMKRGLSVRDFKEHVRRISSYIGKEDEQQPE